MVKMQGKKKSGRQCLLIAACVAISAQCAFSENVVSESFESGSLGDVWTDKSGGTIVEETYTPSATQPLPTQAHAKVLNIAGDVVCTPSDTASANTLDVMVKLTAVDELETPYGNPQVALAVAKNETDSSKVDLKIYAKNTANATDATWIDLKTGLTAETWARITLFFDYPNGKVRVSYNCEYIGDYYLINNNPGNKINSLTFSGSTSIDDVVMTATAAEEYNPYKDASGNDLKKEVAVGTNEKLDVSLNDLAKWGVNAENITIKRLDNSGLTVAQKLVAGLDPTDNKKFELKTMEITANTATLTFPGTASNERYTVIASTDKDGNSPISGAKTTISNDGTGKKAEVTLPENPPDVIYFKVKAAVPAASAK